MSQPQASWSSGVLALCGPIPAFMSAFRASSGFRPTRKPLSFAATLRLKSKTRPQPWGSGRANVTLHLLPCAARAANASAIRSIPAIQGRQPPGLFTRFFAAAIAIEMGCLTFVQYWGHDFAWTNRGYEYGLLWGLVSLSIALRGGGPWSLDRRIGREL